PTLTFIRPRKADPSTSERVKPGIHGAMRSTSLRTSHRVSADTGRTNESVNSKAVLPQPGPSGETFRSEAACSRASFRVGDPAHDPCGGGRQLADVDTVGRERVVDRG